jgi:hypothetical protein
MNLHIQKLIGILLITLATHAHAQFDGNLELIPAGCESIGQCKLKNPLRFTDSSKVVWEARADLPTDGASIPGIFQPFVGSPYDPAFIKAAIIHDHYCDRHVRPWRQTHKVFYEGLIDQGVSKGKAKTMYFAVLLGGPKWIKLVEGINCGKNCVNSQTSLSGTPGIYARRADYTAPDLSPAIHAISKVLEENPDALSLDDLEKEAKKVRPNDFFFMRGNTVSASELGITQ